MAKFRFALGIIAIGAALVGLRAVIETPVLVINALDDPYANPENVRGLAERFPNARLFLVTNGGHVILGHTQEIQAEITKFLLSHVAMPDVTNK